MGVEMDKDNFREDQFNFNLKDFSKDDILGDKLSEYQILKMVESTSNISKGKKLKFNAKVLSKKNSKIYLLKKIRETPTKEQMNEQFEILANLNNNNIAKYPMRLIHSNHFLLIIINGPMMKEIYIS